MHFEHFNEQNFYHFVYAFVFVFSGAVAAVVAAALATCHLPLQLMSVFGFQVTVKAKRAAAFGKPGDLLAGQSIRLMAGDKFGKLKLHACCELSCMSSECE